MSRGLWAETGQLRELRVPGLDWGGAVGQGSRTIISLEGGRCSSGSQAESMRSVASAALVAAGSASAGRGSCCETATAALEGGSS